MNTTLRAAVYPTATADNVCALKPTGAQLRRIAIRIIEQSGMQVSRRDTSSLVLALAVVLADVARDQLDAAQEII